MKKMMMTLAAVFCCAMTMSVFSACGDDESEQKPDKPVACCMEYLFSVTSQDLFKNVDFTVEYYDAEGKVQSERMVNELWTDTIKAKLPGKLGARVKMKLKDGANPASIDTFKISYTFRIYTYVLTADGKKKTNHLESGMPSREIKGSKVPGWVEENPVIKEASFGYSFDADGNYTNTGF